MKLILVADDEFDLANTLRFILEGEGYAVQTCSDGRQVLERLKTSKPDLVLLDVMMPLLGGADVVRVMRNSMDFRDTPVILMSVLPPEKNADRQWQAFLRKPFTLRALVETVKEYAGNPASAELQR